ESTERLGAKLNISRAEKDEFSALSHQRAAAAVKNGLLAAGIVGVAVPRRGGDPLLLDEDEGIRPETTAESLGRLRPAFAKDGTITAGALGATVLAEVGTSGSVAGPDNSLHSQLSNAIRRSLAKAGLTVADLDPIAVHQALA